MRRNHPQVLDGLLSGSFNLRRYRVNALSDNPAYLAGRQRSCEGMRLAGVPEA